MTVSLPVVGVPADRRVLEPHAYHMVGEKYLTALARTAGVLPVVLPVLEGLDYDALLAHVDGILLTGSYSNVEPRRYGGPPSAEGTLHDLERDAVTLPLIPRVLERGMPLFAICRGFQEVNVAFGGTLHQRVHEVPGLMDHREDATQPLEIQYGPAHEVVFAEDGRLRRITGLERAEVNSVHWQGIDRLGEGLRVEATAPDGLVEAVTAEAAGGFNLAVQWHPEWRAADNALSRSLFEAFGGACREYAENKR